MTSNKQIKIFDPVTGKFVVPPSRNSSLRSQSQTLLPSSLADGDTTSNEKDIRISSSTDFPPLSIRLSKNRLIYPAQNGHTSLPQRAPISGITTSKEKKTFDVRDPSFGNSKKIRKYHKTHVPDTSGSTRGIAVNRTTIPKKDDSPFVVSSQHHLYTNRNVLKKHLESTLFFRMVEDVYPEYITEDPIVVYKEHELALPLVLEDPEDFEGINETDFERRGRVYPHSFTLVTSRKSLRDNDPYDGRQVILSSENYCCFDPINMEYVPYYYTNGVVPAPQYGDMVVFLPDQGSVIDSLSTPTKPIMGSSWFVCSYQLLKMFTMVCYGPSHASFSKFKGDKYRLRDWLMQGSRLTTNSYLKKVLAAHDSGIQFDHLSSESKSAYIYSRMENSYVDYIHIYAAIVTIVCYGKLPTSLNVPKDKDMNGNILDVNVKSWHLPPDFVNNFILRWFNYALL